MHALATAKKRRVIKSMRARLIKSWDVMGGVSSDMNMHAPPRGRQIKSWWHLIKIGGIRSNRYQIGGVHDQIAMRPTLSGEHTSALSLRITQGEHALRFLCASDKAYHHAKPHQRPYVPTGLSPQDSWSHHHANEEETY